MSDRVDRYRPIGSLRPLNRQQRAFARSVEAGERTVDRVMGGMAVAIGDIVRAQGDAPLTDAQVDRIMADIDRELDRIYGARPSTADGGQLGRAVAMQARDAGIAVGIATVEGRIRRLIQQDPELRAAMGLSTAQLNGDRRE